MPTVGRRNTIVWATNLAALLVGCLAAGPVAAEERCTGTLCDFYYGGSPPETPPAAKDAAPKPLMVPSAGVLGKIFSPGDPATAPTAPGSAPAPASRPLIGVGGGGVLGMAKGVPAERCGGTFCDLYYGSPSPEEERAAREPEHPDPRAAPAPAAPVESASDEGDAPAPPPPRRRVRAAEPATPRCAATVVHDPWSCYR